MWIVPLVLAVAPAAGDAGSPPATLPANRSSSVKPSRHLCVERFGGTRFRKIRPAYVSVVYPGGPPQEVGVLTSRELKCFELAEGAFTVQLKSFSAATADEPRTAEEICGEVQVSGLRAGWIKVSVNAGSKSPTGCPWMISSRIGGGPLPTLPPRSEELVEKDFLVLPVVGSYVEARRVAALAARRLGLKLDLRGARPTAKGGLTFSRAECDANDWDYPCYVSRGRYDDGAYVSVDEAGSFFDGEERGYLVILGSGPKDDPATRALLEKARSPFPKAEIRTDDVSLACIH